MKGKPSSGAGVVPRAFRVKWDADKSQWGVIQGARWRFATSLCVQVTVTSEDGALCGVGVVRSLKRGEIVVTA